MIENDFLLEFERFISDIVFCGINNIDISVIDKLMIFRDNLISLEYLVELIDKLIFSIKKNDNTDIIDNLTKIDFYIQHYIVYSN